jgi:hypothetical protein
MAIDTIEITVVLTGLGGFFRTKIMAARANDNNPAPMARTTATELKKIIPSYPIGGKEKYVTLTASVADIKATTERNLDSLCMASVLILRLSGQQNE